MEDIFTIKTGINELIKVQTTSRRRHSVGSANKIKLEFQPMKKLYNPSPEDRLKQRCEKIGKCIKELGSSKHEDISEQWIKMLEMLLVYKDIEGFILGFEGSDPKLDQELNSILGKKVESEVDTYEAEMKAVELKASTANADYYDYGDYGDTGDASGFTIKPNPWEVSLLRTYGSAIDWLANTDKSGILTHMNDDILTTLFQRITQLTGEGGRTIPEKKQEEVKGGDDEEETIQSTSKVEIQSENTKKTGVGYSTYVGLSWDIKTHLATKEKKDNQICQVCTILLKYLQ